MVDAARQMLDELMGRNRNLHPSEAQQVNWEDPDFCTYYIVKFCPHDLFVNTRADLGPCNRVHDDEARKMYEEARQSARKRHYEDEFLRFCNTMLNDVDRKIQKGKQRLELMNKDKPAHSTSHLSRYQEQLNNLEAKIKKLLTEAEEAGIRGDVDQAQDLMVHCEQLREERDAFVAQNESIVNKALADADKELRDSSPKSNNEQADGEKPPKDGDETVATTNVASPNETNGEKKPNAWMQDSVAIMNEKQMEVCETCGAFLIVGDAQQRIEDHLMGKQHLGYSKLRQAVTEIHERRQKERDEEDRRRRNERSHRSSETDRRRDHRERERECDYREHHSREHSNRHSSERHHRHYSSRESHSRRSHSRSRSHHNHHGSRDRRERSRSHSRSRSRY